MLGKLQSVLLALYLSFCSPCCVHAQSSPFYPEGTTFPLGVYGILTNNNVQEIYSGGATMVQTYKDPTLLLSTMSTLQMGLLSVPLLPARTMTGLTLLQVEQALALSVQRPTAAWITAPEELKVSIPDERALLAAISDWVKTKDVGPDGKRLHPLYMYSQSGNSYNKLVPLIPYLDIINAGVYTSLHNMPALWVRWVVGEAIKAITVMGATVGPRYREGEKTPIVTIQMYRGSNGLLLNPQEFYYTCWQSILSGARGVFFYEYSRVASDPALQDQWRMAQRFMTELRGSTKLDQVVLFGDRTNPILQSIWSYVISGPTTLQLTLQPYMAQGKTDYASLNKTYRTVDTLPIIYENNLYLFAVNSATVPVRVRIQGLPVSAGSLSELLKGGTVQFSSGMFLSDFEPLEVKVFRLSLNL